MEKKYSIGFFILVFAAMCALLIGYRVSYNHVQEEYEARQEAKENAQENIVSADGAAAKNEFYYLTELDGYVVVYLGDKETVYEYTNIKVDDLPDSVKEEVENGKTIESTKALYGFLENYSS